MHKAVHYVWISSKHTSSLTAHVFYASISYFSLLGWPKVSSRSQNTKLKYTEWVTDKISFDFSSTIIVFSVLSFGGVDFQPYLVLFIVIWNVVFFMNDYCLKANSKTFLAMNFFRSGKPQKVDQNHVFINRLFHVVFY